MNLLTIKNKTFGNGIPKICIPITGRDEKEILEAAGRASAFSADVIEWRADHYKAVTSPDAIYPVLTALRGQFPDALLLFTFRTKKEGGVRELSDWDYLKLCRTAAESGLIDLLDLELFTGADTPEPSEQTEATDAPLKASGKTEMVPNYGLLMPILSLAHEHGCHVLLSSHDFIKTPPEDELLRRLSLMETMGADLAKLAVMPRCARDVLTLLSATRTAADTLSCPVITMSMGKLGTVSRISGSLTGSCLTFGVLGEESAPGQLPAETLKCILEVL